MKAYQLMNYSRFFKRILDIDKNTYGQVQLDGVALSAQTLLPTASVNPNLAASADD